MRTTVWCIFLFFLSLLFTSFEMRAYLNRIRFVVDVCLCVKLAIAASEHPIDFASIYAIELSVLLSVLLILLRDLMSCCFSIWHDKCAATWFSSPVHTNVHSLSDFHFKFEIFSLNLFEERRRRRKTRISNYWWIDSSGSDTETVAPMVTTTTP